MSNAVCLRDPNFSESTVGISELVGVCVLRCDPLELFKWESRMSSLCSDSRYLSQGMKSLNYLGGLCQEGWASELFMNLHITIVLRGRLDGPHSHGS